MLIPELIAKLQALPNQNGSIVAQVVAEDGKAWTLCFDVHPVPLSDWMAGVISLTHPLLKTLPAGAFEDTRDD